MADTGTTSDQQTDPGLFIMTPMAKKLDRWLPEWAVPPVLGLLYLAALLVIFLLLGTRVADIPYMDAVADAEGEMN